MSERTASISEVMTEVERLRDISARQVALFADLVAVIKDRNEKISKIIDELRALNVELDLDARNRSAPSSFGSDP